MGAAVLAAALLANPLSTATAEEQQFLACVRQHESRGDYKAQNPVSTSSGAYQFIDATWLGNAKWARWGDSYPARGYAKARHAPAWVQDLVALHSIRRGGFRHWHGTGCTFHGRVA